MDLEVSGKMLTTALLNRTQAPVSFEVGTTWSSFERFRQSGPSGLEQIRFGTMGVLQSKGAQYRILADADFQYLLGLATEVDRLKQGLHVVMCAARVVEKHTDKDSIDTLMAAISMIKIPELPIRNEFSNIKPEGINTAG